MATTSTPEEVEQPYLAAMGPDLGALCYRFWNECVQLHMQWNEYVELFAVAPKRVDLLNAVAGQLFRLVQDALWDQLLLHLTRLTDQPESGRGKSNLSLGQVRALVEPAIKQNIEDLVAQASEKCEFARDWRNRRIAHRDLHLAMGAGAKPLARANRQTVDEAIAAIDTALGALERHYRKTTVIFDLPRANAVQMLHTLRDGLEAAERRMARIKSGRPCPHDLEARRPV